MMDGERTTGGVGVNHGCWNSAWMARRRSRHDAGSTIVPRRYFRTIYKAHCEPLEFAFKKLSKTAWHIPGAPVKAAPEIAP
jgi:hypothetical protein